MGDHRERVVGRVHRRRRSQCRASVGCGQCLVDVVESCPEIVETECDAGAGSHETMRRQDGDAGIVGRGEVHEAALEGRVRRRIRVGSTSLRRVRGGGLVAMMTVGHVQRGAAQGSLIASTCSGSATRQSSNFSEAISPSMRPPSNASPVATLSSVSAMRSASVHTAKTGLVCARVARSSARRSALGPRSVRSCGRRSEDSQGVAATVASRPAAPSLAAVRVLKVVIDGVEAGGRIANQDAEIPPRRQKRRGARVPVVDALDVIGVGDAVVDAHDVAQIATVQLLALRVADDVVRRREHAAELHVLGVVSSCLEGLNAGHARVSVADGASGLQSRTWRS